MGIKKRIALFLVNGPLAGPRLFESKAALLRFAGMQVGKGTKIVGPLFCTGDLTVGENCWLGRGLTVHGNGAVVIGSNCDLGPEVAFLTGGHAIGGPERRAGAGKDHCIRVADGCWIGARAALVGDITVGAGAVLGACACAVADVPENTLVGGVPAKVLRKL